MGAALVSSRPAPVSQSGEAPGAQPVAGRENAKIPASGGGRESNPPASSRPHTGIEDRGSLPKVDKVGPR